MQANTHAPAAIFGSDVRYVVPLFQRPYVWTLDEQWAPLWDDVRNVAERILTSPPPTFGTPRVAPHFLGAIVLDQQPGPAGYIGVRHIIDGQQRLTTLQLLLDAAQVVVEEHGHTRDAQALRVLVLNDDIVIKDPDEVYKVWPTDRDQAAFRAAMDNNTTSTGELAKARIAVAHKFFTDSVRTWALEGAADAETITARLRALVQTLRDHLKIVVIDLEPGDNAQVIFETLNHRGARLLAADLVKNLLFQLLTAQQADVAGLYTTHWRKLDDDYWRVPVAQGRLYRPRIDLFLNYWLTMKLLREVPTDRVFADFRDYVAQTQPDIPMLLAELAADAAVYESFDKAAPSTVDGRFYYRVVKAMDTAVVGPLMLWLLRQDPKVLPTEQRDKALNAVESWLVRRALCRLSAKDVNGMVLDVLKALNEIGPATAGDTIEVYLNKETAQSRFWPTDSQVSDALAIAPLYRNLPRPRMRMLLEAIEDSKRDPTGAGHLGEGQLCPRGLSVEHVMPQGWWENWGTDIAGDKLAGLSRDALVQTLGNLTLVTGKLNTSLSNRAWDDAAGIEGKHERLLANSHLKLNVDFVSHTTGWTEDDIRTRTETLTQAILGIWPRPTPHTPPVPEQVAALADAAVLEQSVHELVEPGNGEGVTGILIGEDARYAKLGAWLAEQAGDEAHLVFADVEDLVQFPLPTAARSDTGAWTGYDSSALGRAVVEVGWRASLVDLADETVVFVREAAPSN